MERKEEMKNRVTAFIEFYFKGKQFRPSIELDLDEIMETRGELPQTLHSVIAKANDIDPYSYEYEMLEAEEIQYRDAEGLATRFIDGGRFDCQGFERAWRQQQIEAKLREIAARHMKIAPTAVTDETLQALRQAYELGSASAKPRAPTPPAIFPPGADAP